MTQAQIFQQRGPPYQQHQQRPPQRLQGRGQHQARPQRGNQQGGRGQAFNLSLEEAVASGEVVADNILVTSYPTAALFDSGASHSFISARFATRLGMEFESLPERL
ncbi:hypothetical protein ACDT16_13945, partial [Staphylococcus aureus]